MIPTFGNDFFEKIIFYNENFKINNLYDNLKWVLEETVSYYINIFNNNSIKSLTKDLKLKIFSLNNLDKIIEKKNKQIIENFNIKFNDFTYEYKI